MLVKADIHQVWVYGRAEKLHKLTPNEIINNLRGEIQKSTEWSISPKELIEVISKPDFPERMANQIKILILDYHSECVEDHGVFGETPDLFIATHCYYTMHGEDGNSAKARYRQAFLTGVIEPYWPDVLNDDPSYFLSWKDDCIKNFNKYFGPDPARWEQKIKHKFGRDFAQNGC